MASDGNWREQTPGWARIEPEQAGDIGVIRGVIASAYASTNEADLVDNLRKNEALTLSLIARHDSLAGDDAVLGHIAFSPVSLNGIHGNPPSWGMGPISVRPDWQSQGIGAALVGAGLHMARKQGIGLVFVLGHPDYYTRFGFEPGARYGFEWDHGNVGRAFQVIGLDLTPAQFTGRTFVRYRPEYDAIGI